MTERGHVLVTGGSGFVGSAIVRELLAHGFRLRLAVRDPRQAASLGDTVSAAVIGDLAEPVDWSRHLDGIDAVVHAAGLAHAETKSAAKQLFKVNAEATDRLMQAARRAGVRAITHRNRPTTMAARSSTASGPSQRPDYREQSSARRWCMAQTYEATWLCSRARRRYPCPCRWAA
jgi:nucleoside-diphosphate-sugar epimerase